ncbi:MAG: chloride channel protein [Deltaproteobacteria bacterium]|nr:chloride channel protein [Deltaproteobacteria bacterium]
MELVAAQPAWAIIAVPLVGIALAVLVLEALGRAAPVPPRGWRAWVTFRPDAVRADITDDVQHTAGQEELFPWRLAPIRLVAVLATVGLGAPMGTEAPAVYFGEAAGAWVGDHGRRWSRLLRPAALGGGAAGVGALMGIPLVGAAYILELGLRQKAPLAVERIVAAVIGGIIGWGLDVIFDLSLIRLVVPKEPPLGAVDGALTAVCIGVVAGVVSGLAGAAIHRAKKWKAPPAVRLVLGGLATCAAALAVVFVASPAAASGPGGGAITWAERDTALASTVLVVAVLRAAMTTSAAAAGGCGGIFVPLLAIGDLAGRAVAPALGIGHDLAGAAGAAAGISAGYRLPFTAVAMVLGYGGPRLATLACLATVAIAFFVGETVDVLLAKLARARRAPPGDA